MKGKIAGYVRPNCVIRAKTATAGRFITTLSFRRWFCFFFVFRETVNRVYSIGSRGNDSNDSVNYCCIFDDGTEQSVSQPMKMVIVVVHDDSFHVWSQILLNMKEEKRRREKKYVKTQLVN